MRAAKASRKSRQASAAPGEESRPRTRATSGPFTKALASTPPPRPVRIEHFRQGGKRLGRTGSRRRHRPWLPGRRPGDPVSILDSLFPHPDTILDESLLQAFPESVSADERSDPRTVGKNRANQRQEESERSISRTVEGKMRREISL